MKKTYTLYIVFVFLLVSCHQAQDSIPGNIIEDRTPVTVTHATVGSLTDVVLLNATSRFLLKTSVKSDVNGYLQKVNIQLGQKVNQGQELFVVRSKESEHLGNTISRLDSSFHFSGLVNIKSPAPGYITELSYQTGDYVQDNEVLATISESSSLVFLLELPFELTNGLLKTKPLSLPFRMVEIYKGTFQSSMPSVDPCLTNPVVCDPCSRDCINSRKSGGYS